MLKQIKEVNELVHTWDLDQEQRNKKLEILMKWEAQLEKEEFKTILEICNEFNYYSERLTAQAYKSVFEKNACSIEDFDTFIEQSLFMPLRRKDRFESAIGMFFSFINVNKINVNRTYVNSPADYLKKYKASKEYFRKIDNEYSQEDDNQEATILSLQKELQAYNKNTKLSSKIKKRISKLQFSKARRKLRLEKLIEDFHENYFSVKNLIIVDDFIGTGDSVVTLLKEIGRIIGDSVISINLFLWVIEASESGMEEIEKKAKELRIKIEISFYKISTDVLEEDIIFARNNINGVKEMIKKINKRNGLRTSRYCKNHAIASFVNAPNNNLTVLSEESSTWTALFLRTKRNKVKRKTSSAELKDTFQYLRK
ncbi:phosphoribosyltransferase-like protein [Bacillus cereus]|uniref:PRTase-CE domain-containing protein n=1 Tax=Bacillus cereus HuA4-10 TaxID=1053206 RepID=J8DDU8_BACCE|nr:hypothetical protein [Bacillus cereus]EJQ74339.1 hypothetical protein IGC_04890 [Bacillus cereus HuA4-10]